MKYSIGLDIGTTSIGWAVIDEDKKRIQDVGVRIFELPEDPKSGKSLAEPRRTARSTRRRLRRRRQRLNTLKDFFVKHNLLSQEVVESVLAPENQYNPYEIRERAIKEKVSNEELFVALYHIAKRRGYKSNRKSLEEKDSDGSRVLSAISDNKLILKDYNTVASALNSHQKFVEHKRNKRDSYINSFARQNFLDEAEAIIEKQRSLGLNLSDSLVKELLYADDRLGNFNGIFSQRPFMTSALIKKMRGTCELEPNEHRAPRASYSFEMFRIAQNLSHLRIEINGKIRALTSDEITSVIEKAKSIKTLKYSHIRAVLGYKKDSSFAFARGMIRGKVKEDDKTNGETNKFDEMTFYHSVKSAFKQTPEEWSRIELNKDILDEIGEVLTINKDDLSIKAGLMSLGIPVNVIDELLKLNFSGFGHLSIKALRKIIPFLLQGKNYDESVVSAGYKFIQNLSGDKTKLPPLSSVEGQQITNPVAKRAISQSIKVINAIILKYGAPNKIKIEAAGDLAKTFSDRQKIRKIQNENADYNEKVKNRLVDEFHVMTPTGLQITKFKLYNQQNGKCIYSGKPLDLNRLFADERYGEIDHIIPFSRCGNDGLNNKVLVLTEENQQKRNLTPYEAWGNNESRWKDFEARVNATFLPFAKKNRLLAKSPPSEEWNQRAINDTRYISKFLRSYIRDNLKFADYHDEKGTQRVITPTGSITSYLRRVWHVGNKNRDASNFHHATDACIIAAVDQGVIQKVSRLNKYYELFKYINTNEVTDRVTGQIIKCNELEQHSAEIEPWPDFGKEVRIRTGMTAQQKDGGGLKLQTPGELHNELRGLDNYDEAFRLSTRPIFVSRMPKRGGKGLVNKETIRSPKIVEDYKDNEGKRAIARKQRVPLINVRLKDLEDSPVRQDTGLYEVLKARLEEFSDDPQKAFSADNPVYKPTKDGTRGNIVRSIKVYDTQNSKTGFYINDGKAFVNNGNMARLDVYQKKNAKGNIEHFFVPVYTRQIGLEKTGLKITKIMPEPKGFTDVDETFTKVTSLFSNDYVRIRLKDKIEEGYYKGYDVSVGSMTLLPHSATDAKSTFRVSPRSAISIESHDISILGDNYKWV